MDLELPVTEKNGWTVISPVGEIDVATAPRLRERLIELGSGGASHIVVDFEQVDFIDSTGLGVLVGALRRARSAHGDVRVVCTNSRILKVFEITGLDAVFAAVGTLDEATSSPARG